VLDLDIVEQKEIIEINKSKLQSPTDGNDLCEQNIGENDHKIIQEAPEYHDKIEPCKEFFEKQEQGKKWIQKELPRIINF